MFSSSHWFFSRDDLYTGTPSRRSGISYSAELIHRQECANLIQKIAKRLQLPQVCVMTAVVYMHRFYMEHSVSNFPVHVISMATLFLSSKAEDKPRKLIDVVIHGYWTAFRVKLESNSQQLLEETDCIVFHENLLLQTFGFEVMVEHPHLHIIRFCQLAGIDKSVAKSAYEMATNSIMVTTICLRYKPSVLASFFIYITAKSSGSYHIFSKQQPEGKPNFFQFFKDVNLQMLQVMTHEFERSLDDSEGVSTVDMSLVLGNLNSSIQAESKQVSPDFVNSDPGTPEMDCPFGENWLSDSSESKLRNQKRPREDCNLPPSKMSNNNRLPGLL